MPGAIFNAIIAASINSVPEPQNKSNNGDFWSHSDNPIIPAAKFSFSGASPVFVRYPRMNKEFPVVSKAILYKF